LDKIRARDDGQGESRRINEIPGEEADNRPDIEALMGAGPNA
jgi:hypothetical protein